MRFLFKSSGSACNLVDGSGQTSLMMAAAEGHIDVCLLIIERGGDLMARDANKWSALHHACEGKQEELALALVAAGAAVDVVTQGGCSLKHMNYDIGVLCEEAAVEAGGAQLEEIEVAP